MSVCLSVPLFTTYILWSGYYGSDCDETWWQCWNLGSIDCIYIKKKKRLFNIDVISDFLALLQRDRILRQRETMNFDYAVPILVTQAIVILFYSLDFIFFPLRYMAV